MIKDISGVIFDMDGLMVDTEYVTYINYKRAMEESGYYLTLDMFKNTIGFRSADTRKYYESIFDTNFNYEEIRLKVVAYFWEYAEKNGIPLKKGIFELLEFLKENNIKCAVATSTARKRASRVLKETKLYDYMDAFIYGDMVTNGKPHPEIYLNACNLINADPTKCIGLEDSYNGIKSVYNAKMIPIFIEDLLPSTDEINKIIYKEVKDLTQVIDLIKK